MGLDDTVENILKAMNTEVKMLVQLILDPHSKIGMTGAELARLMSSYNGRNLDESTIIKTCKNLAKEGALTMSINRKRTANKPGKYYFNVRKNSRYRALAALGLKTVSEIGVSFYDIFGNFGGTKMQKNGRSNLASKGVANTFKVLLNFYKGYSTDAPELQTLDFNTIQEKLGIGEYSARSLVDRLEEAELVRVEEKECEFTYYNVKPLGNVEGRKDWVQLCRDIGFAFGNLPFTMNELANVLPQYKRKRISDALRRLTLDGYFVRENGKKPYDIILTEKGRKLVDNFVLPMYKLLNNMETRESIYARAGDVGEAVIKTALDVYTNAEKHIVK